MEIWYALTGNVDKREVQDAIRWMNQELYSKPIDRLRFLIASGGGEIEADINLHTYLKALPFEVETIGFGEVDAAAILVFCRGKRGQPSKAANFSSTKGATRWSIQPLPFMCTKKQSPYSNANYTR